MIKNNIEIIKSKKDNRIYKYITLKNKLKVVLISDTENDVSSAALAINVGCYNDEIEGMAHFLEHMLFMGSKKYPDENYYQSFIGKNEGTTNAYTSNTVTCYYFEILSVYLEKSLDIFSRFFIDPLFKENGIDREMNAVDSEFKKNKLSYLWRIQDVLRECCDITHPMNKFSTGSLKTLNVPNIRNKLIDFYNKYYSANIMNLVIIGNHSIEHLEKMVISSFSDIPNKNITISQIKNIPFSITNKPQKNDIPVHIKIVPFKNKDIMLLLWQIPRDSLYYKEFDYIKYLFIFEGKNSIIDVLYKQNLILNLNFEIFDEYENLLIAGIEIVLTPLGISNKKAIIESVFLYFKLIQKGISKKIYNDKKLINTLLFDAQNKDTPSNYAINIVNNMFIYPIEYIVANEIIYKKYSDTFNSIINILFKSFVLEKTIIVDISKIYENKLRKYSKWFNVEYEYNNYYNLNKISNKNNINIDVNDLKIMTVNNYIPSNISIVNYKNTKPYPVLIYNESIKIWYYFNNTFNNPLVCIGLYFNNDINNINIKNHIITVLYINVINIILNEKLFLAKIIGYNFNIEIKYNKIVFNIHGFYDKINDILKIVLDTFFNPNKKDFSIYFEIIKNKYLKNILNYNYENQMYVVKNFLKKNTLNNYFSPLEIQQYLNSNMSFLSYDIILKFSKKMFIDKKLSCFICGNINMDIVKSISKYIITKYSRNLSQNIIPLINVKKYDNVDVLNIMKPLNKMEKNTAIIMIYQIQYIKKNDDNSNKLFNWKYILCSLVFLNSIISESFFNQLRTKEQLGYIVNSDYLTLGDLELPMYYYNFYIQSPVASFEELTAKILKFTDDFKQNIIKMTDTDYKNRITNCINDLQKKYISIFELFNCFFTEILSNSCLFNYKDVLIDTFKIITLNDILSFYMYYFINDTKKYKIFIVEKNK
jgi:insulysin